VCVLALSACGRAAEVVLVRQILKTPTRWTTQALVDQTVNRMRDRLAGVGVIPDTIDDSKLSVDSLAGAKVAVLPYNAKVPEPAVQTLQEFVQNGGKLICFYHAPPELLPLLGIEKLEYKGGADLPKLGGVRFDTKVLAGAPKTMKQASWNINEPVLLNGKGARLAGTWLDKDGTDTKLAALVLHANGAYFAHVYLDEEPAAGGRFLLALLGDCVPDIWQRAVEARLLGMVNFPNIKTLADLERTVAASGRSEATDAFAKARRRRDEAQQLLNQGKPSEALTVAEEAVSLASDAYLASCRSRSGELRGAWIHSAYGVDDWGWDRSVKVLADNGFNALFVNMCWGAVADYQSSVLPVHPDVATQGDQIKACLAACQKYGIELHVWKVNWNMGHRTPKAIRDKMVAEGRTQVSLDGKPSTFLAPHLEKNFALERDAMLEIVRKYRVAGIHFDYIRYPNDQCDFSDSAKQAFTKWLGQDAAGWPKSCAPGGALRAKYNEWRRGNISRLVKAVSEEAHRIRPDIKVSAAVFGAWDTTRDTIAQDTVTWLKNGWLDFVCPMDYTNSATSLERLVRLQEPLTPASVPLYVGIGSWRHDGPAQTAAQIDLARRLGADGFVCFAHNEKFAEQILPGLAKGATREPVHGLLPHQSIQGTFTMPEPDEELGTGFRVGDELRFELELPANVNRVEPQITVLVDGYPKAMGPRLRIKQRRRGVAVEIRPPVGGLYRLEVSGTWTDKERHAKAQPFLVRSRTVQVFSAEEAEQILAKQRPPGFQDNGGIKVAVWQDDAYGAAPILSLLQRTPGLDAAPLWNLKRESLEACQVVILCQPRAHQEWFKDEKTADELARFVEHGGGLLTTHALVGIRGFLPPVPNVAAGDERLPGATWKASYYHAITRGLDRRATYTSTFPDRIGIVVGKSGRAIVRTPEGKPIVVAGLSGRGRYVACGLGLGIGKGDRDASLSSAEGKLLLGAVQWLANVRGR
jgi:uncharacterized lipoprotein YddW (UPF0748 family)